MKLVIGALVLIPVLLHLGYAVYATPLANYYIGIDQYMTRSANSPIRIGGTIAPGTIRYDNATRTMRFTVTGENSQVDVAYRGAVPDSFRDGATAILDGARSADGGFAATALAIKCPHSYLPAGW
jgi:cytochrome c-type biogenesis protein CcmE